MPIDGSGLARILAEKPTVSQPRDRYVYRPNTQSVPFNAAPRVLNRPHSITASVEIPEGGAEGVLLSQGTAAGGYSLFVKDGKLHYVHNYVGRALYGVTSEDELPAGKHEVRFEFEPTGEPDLKAGKGAPGSLQLYVDGTLVADAEAPVTTPFMINPGALTCGANPGSPVTSDYSSPFKFTGTLHEVTVDVGGDLIQDPEAELRAHMARQ
jgi:arylsulfatase